MTNNTLKDSNGHLQKKILKEGSINKQGGRIKTWKRRWCILNEEGLHYYKSQNSIEKGSISIDSIMSVETDDKPQSKKKHCFKVVTVERNYRICATDGQDRDEWVQSISKLLKPKQINLKNSVNNIGGQLKSSTGSVDINRSFDTIGDDQSSTGSTPPSSFLEKPSRTVHITPTMMALKEKFNLNTFSSELNRKKDLLSQEETERLLEILNHQIVNEVEKQTADRLKEIQLIKNQLNKLREQEINLIQEKYATKRLEVLNEINKRSQTLNSQQSSNKK
ncbi:hypothetical protein DLAC_09360 [Tieghemostelium lacteum]|uniref:PH domain-containing protein n=1 Tax=Tieghemostelium lacteum TaxID=361077 RepID=A0A151Z9W8_TIELA|nr:hypothetical protein DLAC_09360 [Tieghemostelium lacteum]|eukprot:KYQ90723.1 hypothetical protein DLAC_09360 [Tieghemostelium lacteum]